MQKEKELRRSLLIKGIKNRQKAWEVKNYEQSIKLREQEKKDYEKWKLLDGIIKAKEKGKK